MGQRRVSGGEPDSDAARRIVVAYIDALNAADVDRITACVADAFWNEHVAVSSHSLCGREAYRERLPGFLATYRDIVYSIERLVVDGADVALAYRMTYNWHGAEPFRPVTTRGLFLFRIEGGLIAHRIDYRDSADARRQMDAA